MLEVYMLTRLQKVFNSNAVVLRSSVEGFLLNEINDMILRAMSDKQNAAVTSVGDHSLGSNHVINERATVPPSLHHPVPTVTALELNTF